MKICPITANRINNQNSASSAKPQSPVSAFVSRYTQPSFYMPVSFKAANSLEFINELKNLDDMHCPFCGTKMISPKENETVLKEADSIKTPIEFNAYLKKYEENINPNFKQISNLAQTLVDENPKIDMENFLDRLYIDSYKKTSRSLKNAMTQMGELGKTLNLSPSEYKLFKTCNKDINELYIKTNHKNVSRDLFDSMKNTVFLLPQEPKEQFIRALYPIKDACIVEYLFSPITLDVKKSESRQKIFLNNLFNYSKSDLKNIKRNVFDDKDRDINVILNCSSCFFKNTSIQSTGNTFAQSYYRHLEELAQRSLEGKLNSNKEYPLLLKDFVKKISKHKLNPDDNSFFINKLAAETGYVKVKQIDFPLVDHPGVPCSTCGGMTIVHEQKKEIFNKIEKAESLQELSEIMKKNSELVKERHDGLINRFNEVLNRNPDATDASMLKNLKHFQHNKICDIIYQNIAKILVLTEEYRLSHKDRQLVVEFISESGKLVKDSKFNEVFDYKTYFEMTDETLGKIMSVNQNELLSMAKQSFSKELSCQMELFPSAPAVEKVGSAIRVIFQNLINKSLATIDHANPKSRYNNDLDKVDDIYLKNLANRKSHLAVMCNDCNRQKKDKDYKVWFKLHPEIEQNLHKYLKTVQGFSKNGEIKGYETYPYEYAAFINRLTNGKLDVSP